MELICIFVFAYADCWFSHAQAHFSDCTFSNLLIFQVVAKGMIERGQGGSIVMMSSYLSFRAMEIRSVYCCTKAALDQLTRSLAMELGPHKVIWHNQ